ncbi:MAG: hypothetical protein JXR07_01810 [Reichenbachiella sp.]
MAFNIKAVLILLAFVSFKLQAQTPSEKGFPFITNYTHKDFHANSMNYMVARDSIGVQYIANEDGVLVFDGFKWDLVTINKNKPVYFVEVGSDGVVYIGSSNEFGYLSNKNGRLTYVSLLDKIDPKYHDFEVVWEVQKTSNTVVFRSRKYLFVKRGDSVDAIASPEGGFDVAYTINDTVYVREKDIGLCQVIGNEVKVLPGGEYFSNIKLNMYLPYPNGKIMVASRKQGIYIYDHGKVQPLKTEGDSIFYNFSIYHGCVTPNGNYAFASLNSGLVVIDSRGKLLDFFDDKAGLPSNQILSVSALSDKNLWMATGKGISNVQYNSPLTYFDHNLGLRDWVTDVIRVNGILYVSTMYGLYQIDPKETLKFKAKQIHRNNLQAVLSLDLLNNQLLIGAQAGIRSLENNKLTAFEIIKETHKIKVSEDRETIFASVGEDHFGVYYKTKNEYKLTVLDDFIEPIKKIVEFENHLALITNYGNLVILQMSYSGNELSITKKHTYELGSFNGIKYNNELLIFTPKESMLITMEGRIHSKKDLSFMEEIVRINEVSLTADNHIWVCFENEHRINYCEQIFEKNEVFKSCDYKFKTDFRVNNIYSEDRGISWFGGAGGLIRFDSKLSNKNLNENFLCSISELVYNEDSVLFRLTPPKDKIEFGSENITLEFNSFTNDLSVQGETFFQYRLLGERSDWSGWTMNSQKKYENLEHGKYVFQVRAKNSSNTVSEVAEFDFIVLTPFYKSYIAYVLYIAVFFFSIYLFIIWRMNSIKRANRKLEIKVRERTLEVENKKEILDQANKTKNQLFSIIGHDLRSPLNSLQSITELIQFYRKEKNLDKVEEMVNAMTGSVKGLRTLLDNLLSWTLNQSGNLTLNASTIEIQPLFKEVVGFLQENATKKKIKIELKVKANTTFIGDRNSLAIIVRNLLSNAIKFTEEEGKILIEVSPTTSGLEFSVKDNGVGIERDKLDSIYELSNTTYGTSHEKGTGIGLTLVRDFVNLNKGTIAVSSELGEGAKFSVFLPASVI